MAVAAAAVQRVVAASGEDEVGGGSGAGGGGGVLQCVCYACGGDEHECGVDRGKQRVTEKLAPPW